MTKIQIKSEEATPLGGIFSNMELFNPNRSLGFLFAVQHREILMTDLG